MQGALKLVMLHLPGTALMPCLLRFFGANVGHDLLVANDIPMSLFCIDARHIHIGDGVVINHGADVVPHSIDRGLIGHPSMRCGFSRELSGFPYDDRGQETFFRKAASALKRLKVRSMLAGSLCIRLSAVHQPFFC